MEQSSFRSFDWISCLLLTVASVLVTFAFQESGITPNSWTSALFLAPLIIGVLSWLALLAWEWAVDRFWSSLLSMLPLRLLRRRIYHAAALVTLFTGYPYFLIIFNLPLRFQVVNSMSSLSAGIGLLPLVGSSAYVKPSSVCFLVMLVVASGQS